MLSFKLIKPFSLFVGILGVTSGAMAVDLKQILHYSLNQDPTLDEAKANISMAESQTNISRSGHQPVISLTHTQVVKQYHKDRAKLNSEPGISGKINLFSWGAVEYEIERDKYKEHYFQNKLAETREILGQKIGELYLSALSAKEHIAVYQESLKRHNKFLADMRAIVAYDEGVQSDVNEALARKTQLELIIQQQEKVLHSSLSRLSRYTEFPLSIKDLVDPFAKVSANQFIQSYKNPAIKNNPTYTAQQNEFNSNKIAVNAVKARRLPAINLEGTASKHNYSVYVGVSWDIYNPSAGYAQEQTFYSEQAAKAKLREIELELTEKAQTSEQDMIRNESLAATARKQVKIQRNIVKDNEFQFEIATRSILNVLDSYKELTTTQIAEVNARGEFRNAALQYLVSQAHVVKWANIKDSSAVKQK